MKYAILDLETTGHSADDEIIQIGVVFVSHELVVLDTYSSFVKPAIIIPSFITGLTGITNDTVKDAPSLHEVLKELLPLMEDTVLVAHNVGFDSSFLNQALQRSGYLPLNGRKLDTMDLLRILFPSITTYQLGAVADLFGISHDRQHQADSDAMATAEIFILAVQKLRSLPLLTLQRLSALIDSSKDLHWFLRLIEQELEQTTVLESAEYDYYRQFALKAREWSEEQPPRGESGNEGEAISMTFQEYLDSIKSAMMDKFAAYEEREPQNIMFDEVYKALSTDSHLLIEAGTGTGKSLGYLIPALYHGIKSGSKVVVSTHTINLQEQIRGRDVPLLEDVLPFPFRAAIFKGRGNYLCMRKFEGKVNTLDFTTPNEDGITASQMIVWLGETETGDQEELNFGSRGADFWQSVASDADSCLNRACPWFKRCYYHRAKHESNIADVCITNHSLLFTDVQSEHRLLPAYSHLVIDEAHHMEETASKHLGFNVNYYSFINTSIHLFKDSRSGLLQNLRYRLQQEDDERVNAWIETIDALLIPKLQDMKEYWDKLFELLFGLIGTSGEGPGDNGAAVLRLQGTQQPEGWDDIATYEEHVHTALTLWLKDCEKLASDIKERIDDHGVQAALTDLNGEWRNFARIKDELRILVKLEQPEFVYWLEANPTMRHRSLHFYAAPVQVSRQLQTYFFDAKDSVIMTSATLTVQKSFQYVMEQLGLEGYEVQNRLQTVQLPSPFQYRQQALVIVPRDFPPYKGAFPDSSYLERLAQSIRDVAVETGGKMLVLFTSYRMLRAVYELLKEPLEVSGIQVLGQGIDSSNRTKLTRRFLQQAESVLLGTSSFWEGVDIPGEALTCLAIVRLPFQPPNHPVAEAKAELLQRKKQNPFMKLSIPQAVIRFKQGFGRLVRTAHDKGIVIIYDTRVIETYYGKHFLYSLPGPKMETMFTAQIVPRIRDWLMPENEVSYEEGGDRDEKRENIGSGS